MMATQERRTPRSRIHACWRVLFAVVGILDCSCFCYCYYYNHNDCYGENNSMATRQTQPPRLCLPREGWQEYNANQQSRTSNREYIANNKTENSSYATKTRLPETKTSSRLSGIVWHSMAFSFTAESAKSKGSKAPYRCRLEDSNNHKTYHVFLLLHVGFGVFCAIEMILRAREARRIVFENQAIAAFEEHIASTVAKVLHRRNLLLGKGGFKHFNLRRPSDSATKVLSPTTTRTLKLKRYIPTFSFSSHHDILEEARANANRNESNSHDDEKSNDHYHNDNGDDSMDINDEAVDKRTILLFLRSTFKLWLPIGITCFFWLSLLPFQAYYRIIRIFLNNYLKYMFGDICTDGNDELNEYKNFDSDNYCDIDCSHLCEIDAAATECYVETLGEDTALATIWITALLVRWIEACEEIQDYLMSAVWKRYLLGGLFATTAHKKLHKILLDRPKLIWFRLGRILTIVKWLRFAGPLTRMVLKLQDQLRLGYSTFQKVRSVRTNREKRLQRPSLLLKDLRRIESFHKVETTIAAWPSQCSMLLETLAKEVSQYSAVAPTRIKLSSSMASAFAEDFLRKSRERGQQITRQIQRLQGQLRRNMTDLSSSEIYDSILRLSQGVSRRHLVVSHEDSDDDEDFGEEKGEKTKSEESPAPKKRRSHISVKGRWYDFLHVESLLSSRDYLISPRSRFSVVWRITVTNCLLLALTRLAVSWYLTQTFHLSISQVIGRLFVDCGTTKEDTRRKFKFVTDLFEEWHVGLSRAIPLVPFPKDSLWILCVPTSNFSKFLLLLGSAMETFIDIVSFLDIFFWFFTGDLDASTGIVVPKSFFGRCIIPGTLVQVIDHPTLPHFLPSVLAKLASIASELGWSRLVLWACAIFPALVAEVVMPLSSYLFRHFEETEKWDGKSGFRSNNNNENNDLLMAYAESFGYLPTRSSMMLERTAAAPRWFQDTGADDVWSRSHSSCDDSDDSDIDASGNIAESVDRWPSLVHSGILTPPGSPRRSVHRDSNVRFATDVATNREIDENMDSPRLQYGSSTDFNIGLSLSSHNVGRSSNVRFATDVSMVATNDESDYGSSAADFDIGLSLSSHDLDDLQNAKQ